MRKTIFFLLLLTQFSCNAPKPEGLILKVQFQPEKTYIISTIRGSETVITYSGEDIAMKMIKSKHIKNPTISKVKTKTDAELITKKSSSGTSFPVTLTYKNKLLSIKDNMAQFELSQNYQMTPKMMDNSFTGSGIGKGQLSYDIGNFLVTDYSIKTELDMNKKLNYFEFDLKTINEFSHTTQMNKQ